MCCHPSYCVAFIGGEVAVALLARCVGLCVMGFVGEGMMVLFGVWLFWGLVERVLFEF